MASSIVGWPTTNSLPTTIRWPTLRSGHGFLASTGRPSTSTNSPTSNAGTSRSPIARPCEKAMTCRRRCRKYRCREGDLGPRASRPLLLADVEERAGRPRPKDGNAVSLQQFRNERHREVRLAAADRVGSRHAAFLRQGLGGNHLGEADALEQFTQVDAG